MTATTEWVRVTRAKPCPICDHDSWCTVAADGSVVRCKRTESQQHSPGEDGDAWIHEIGTSRPRPGPAARPDRDAHAIDWRAMADYFSTAITDAQVDTLARLLGVAANALRQLGIGWDGKCWTFPMFDADGSVCGVRRRPIKGKKHCVNGSRTGVFRRMKPDEGLAVFVEGESDAAAAITLGFDAYGVPGTGQKVDVAAAYARGREAVAIADNDGPGEDGARKLVAALQRTATSVRLVHPPAQFKDLREWLNAGATRADLEAAIAAAPLAPSTDSEEDKPAAPMKLGHRHPDATGTLVVCPKRTLPTAEAFVREFHTHQDGRTLHHYAGSLWYWVGNRYVEVEAQAIKHALQPWLHAALRPVYNENTRKIELVNFLSNPTTVNAAFLTLSAFVHLSANTPVPSWLGTEPARYPISELLPCRSMTLHIPTGRVLPPTPSLFAFNALDFDYDENAPHPDRWMKFLGEILGADSEQYDLLNEWFGYALGADTSQHKMLLIVGPRRSGKGTLARVLTKLVGAGNVVGPTVSGLAGTFGLQPLLGKTLAVVSDARFSGEHIPTVVERLLCISGEDIVTVDRKNIGSVTLKLPTRFVFLTNELPRFNDASTALAGRFTVLRLTESYFGKEDIGLTDALLAELPGILKWALEGWLLLRERKRFTEPESTLTAITDIEDLSSPVHAFVRERCMVGPGHRVGCAELYLAWCNWCTAEGRTSHTTVQVFGRDLSAAVSNVQRRRTTGRPSFYEGICLGVSP